MFTEFFDNGIYYYIVFCLSDWGQRGETSESNSQQLDYQKVFPGQKHEPCKLMNCQGTRWKVLVSNLAQTFFFCVKLQIFHSLTHCMGFVRVPSFSFILKHCMLVCVSSLHVCMDSLSNTAQKNSSTRQERGFTRHTYIPKHLTSAQYALIWSPM